MTTELTKAAQKNGPEVELCEQIQRAQARVRLLKPDDFDAPELDLSDSHTALFALAEYWKGKHDKLKALTQRPAAQEVASEARELAHNMMLWREDARMHGSEYVPVHVRTLDNLIAQLRGLLAPQQATPAPSAVFSAWWSTQGQSMWQHVSESPAEFARRLAAHAWTEATRAAQQATPAQEPGVFREYFDAHRALIAAKGASERASHAHIVGYRAPSHSTGSEPYEASVARNDQLKRADDAARSARKEAEARFNAALSAAQQATPESCKSFSQLYERNRAGVDAELAAMAAEATPERHLTVTTNQQGEAVMVSWQDDEHRILEVVWERKQATPEPVGEAWGWAIEDTHGVAQSIRPARKEFFGCIQSTEPFTSEDVAKMNREWAGLAPHRIVTLYTRPAAAPEPAVPEGWREVIEKMVKGIDHLAELARQWEPDYSSGADRRGWVLATEARDDALRLLKEHAAAIEQLRASA